MATRVGGAVNPNAADVGKPEESAKAEHGIRARKAMGDRKKSFTLITLVVKFLLFLDCVHCHRANHKSGLIFAQFSVSTFIAF